MSVIGAGLGIPNRLSKVTSLCRAVKWNRMIFAATYSSIYGTTITSNNVFFVESEQKNCQVTYRLAHIAINTKNGIEHL